MPQGHILISYTGPVTPVVVTNISRDIRKKLADNHEASRKVFSIFLELAQNIQFYSEEKVHYADCKDRVGTMYVVETEEQYAVICSNTVKYEDMEALTKGCRVLNLLDTDKLRRLKRIQRRRAPNEKSKGAGIGIIQAALLSRNPLQVYEYKLCSNYSFFTLSVLVDR
jgi:hypothetical protein